MMRLMLAFLLATTIVVPGVHSLNFGIIGDFGLGGRKYAVQTEMRSVSAYNLVCEELKCNFTLSAGDNIYVGDVNEGLRESFEHMYTSPGPTFPSVGNHDNWRPQVEYSKRNKRWVFPEHFFSFTLPIDNTGYTVQVFSVDTTDGSLGGGGQLAWLEGKLRASTARWKLIFGHYPTTGSGRHRRSGTVGHLHRLMTAYNAQVYFCGHDHILEVSNIGGRVLPISGAMARGGMMLRGLGGPARKFTLTQPGEFNKDIQDWPGHGFMTASLSPNVLTLNLWDNCANMVYELSTTHDWLTRVKNRSASQVNDWPPEDVILQAYKDEMTLDPGTGLSDFGSTTTVPVTAAPGQTLAPTTAAPPTTASPPTTLAPLKSLTPAPEAQITIKPQEHSEPKVTYVAGSDLQNTIRVGEPFSVVLFGEKLKDADQIFLTRQSSGCNKVPGKPFDFVEGTHIEQPDSNTETFVATAPVAKAYVCLVRRGSYYFIHKHLGGTEHYFTIEDAVPKQQQQQQQQQATASPTTRLPFATAAPAPAASSISPMAIIALCAVVGVVAAVVTRNINFNEVLVKARTGASAVPSEEMTGQ